MSSVTTPASAGNDGLEPHRSVRHTAHRRTVAKAMTRAAEVPTLTADVRVDLTRLRGIRESWATDRGPRPSVFALLVWNAVRALSLHPQLNASWTDEALLVWEHVNLGVAVDTPKGLIVPVIRHAESLTAPQLTAAIADLAERARTRSLTLADMQDGTFTVSNPGAIGPTLRAEALLNVPQVGLLGLPGITREPVVVTTGGTERVEIRSVISPSLTFDHRALDGADAVRYLVGLRDLIESTDVEDYLTPAAPEGDQS